MCTRNEYLVAAPNLLGDGKLHGTFAGWPACNEVAQKEMASQIGKVWNLGGRELAETAIAGALSASREVSPAVHLAPVDSRDLGVRRVVDQGDDVGGVS